MRRFDLEPMLGWAARIGLVDPLGNDPFEAELLGVPEHGRPVAGDRLREHDCGMLSIEQLLGGLQDCSQRGALQRAGLDISWAISDSDSAVSQERSDLDARRAFCSDAAPERLRDAPIIFGALGPISGRRLASYLNIERTHDENWLRQHSQLSTPSASRCVPSFRAGFSWLRNECVR